MQTQRNKSIAVDLGKKLVRLRLKKIMGTSLMEAEEKTEESDSSGGKERNLSYENQLVLRKQSKLKKS